MIKYTLCLLGLYIICTTSSRISSSQDYVPPFFWFGAEDIYQMKRDQNDSLYDVVMLFDTEQDKIFGGSQNKWNPPIQFTFYWDYWKDYLEAWAPLGVAGPLGPTGPLSSWGPIGNEKWNPSNWITGSSCDWCAAGFKWIEDLLGWGHILSMNEMGPLGERGPLTKQQIYKEMYHLLEFPWLANDFNHNLDIVGVFGILGPLGPLGAMGPLGALGPIGAHGLNATNPVTGEYDGHYRNKTGSIFRAFRTQFEKGDKNSALHRVYELYEFYTSDSAKKLGDDNDTSFMVESKLTKVTSTEKFKFQSFQSQLVSVIVVPIINQISNTSAVFSDFDIEIALLDENSGTYNTFASSSLSSSTVLQPVTSLNGYVDYVIFRAFPDQKFQATVSAKSLDPTNNKYRIYVTGTGFFEGKYFEEEDVDLFNHHNIKAPYQHYLESVKKS